MLLIVFGVTVVCGVVDYFAVPFPSFEEPGKVRDLSLEGANQM